MQIANDPLWLCHKQLGSGVQGFIEALEWLDRNGLEVHLKLALDELPAKSDWWSDLIDHFGEGKLIEFGVDDI